MTPGTSTASPASPQVQAMTDTRPPRCGKTSIEATADRNCIDREIRAIPEVVTQEEAGRMHRGDC